MFNNGICRYIYTWIEKTGIHAYIHVDISTNLNLHLDIHIKIKRTCSMRTNTRKYWDKYLYVDIHMYCLSIIYFCLVISHSSVYLFRTHSFNISNSSSIFSFPYLLIVARIFSILELPANSWIFTSLSMYFSFFHFIGSCILLFNYLFVCCFVFLKVLILYFRSLVEKMFITRSAYRSTYLSICLSIYLSIFLSIYIYCFVVFSCIYWLIMFLFIVFIYSFLFMYLSFLVFLFKLISFYSWIFVFFMCLLATYSSFYMCILYFWN